MTKPEPESEHLTRAEVESIARINAIRDLNFTPDSISYITYHEPFADYYRITIHFDQPDRGEYRMQPLPFDERLEGEKFDDDRIKLVARSGGLQNAVRMYRLLHSVDLTVAKAAVKRMRDEA